MSSSNYNGRQPNNTSYIKNFVYGIPSNLWKMSKNKHTSEEVLIPASTKYNSVQIPGNLYVDGHIINPFMQEQITALKEQIQRMQQDIDELKT